MADFYPQRSSVARDMTAESDWSSAEPYSKNSRSKFLITGNAFYPIKDDFPSSGAPQMTDTVLKPLEERIAALENSRKDLEDQMTKSKQAPKPKKEELLRSNTDLITHLSYKMQVMSESVATLKGKVQGMEEKAVKQQSTLNDVEKMLSNIEKTVLSAQDELLSKQSNELLMVRDAISELHNKIDQQKRSKKEVEQEVPASKLSSLQKTIDQLQKKQEKAEQEMENMLQRKGGKEMEKDDQIRKIVKEVVHKVLAEQDLPKRLGQMERMLAEEKESREDFHQHVKNAIDRNWEEYRAERQDETKKLRELVKVDKARTNASLHKLNDAMINLMEKQMEEHKISQEKLQAEVIARQQFECEILKQLNAVDDKTNQLSQEIDEIHNKREKVRAGVLNQLETLDTARVRAIGDLEAKVNVLSKKKSASAAENESKWKDEIDVSIRQLKHDISKIKDSAGDPKSSSNLMKVESHEAKLKDLNKRLDGLESFKKATVASLEDLDRKNKTANKKLSTAKDAAHALDHPGKDSPAAPQIESLEAQLKEMKKKFNEEEGQLDALQKKLDSFAKKEDLDKIRLQLEAMKKAENDDKADHEKIRSLANAIHLVKGLVAMKLQHEEKARQETMEHLQDQIDNLGKTVVQLKSSKEDDDDDEEEEESADGKGKNEKGKRDRDEEEEEGRKDDKRSGKETLGRKTTDGDGKGSYGKTGGSKNSPGYADDDDL